MFIKVYRDLIVTASGDDFHDSALAEFDMAHSVTFSIRERPLVLQIDVFGTVF